MNLRELLEAPHGGDPDIALFNIGIILGLIPEDTEFSSKGKELIYDRTSLTKLLSDIYYLLINSNAFYRNDERTLKSYPIEELYLVDSSSIKSDKEFEWLDKQPFFHKNELIEDDNGDLFVCVDCPTTEKALRINIPVTKLL